MALLSRVVFRNSSVSEVSDGSTRRRPVQGLGEASVLCCFCFPFVTRTRQWMRIVVTARCLVKRCECRGCYGTDDWKGNADGLSLKTVFEVVGFGPF